MGDFEFSTLASGNGSWGGIAHPQQRLLGSFLDMKRSEGLVLARGSGLSYGDVALNSHGFLLSMVKRNQVLDLDLTSGVVRCESGTTLGELIDVCLPQGWMLPVVPGTSGVTVGGAIANDVHGKNHHREGTFGRHVVSLKLLRTTGDLVECSPVKNVELFKATVAGLGLTGVIVEATLSLKKVSSAWLEMETVPFEDLEAFFDLSEASEPTHEYTVAWVDAMGPGKRLGRGVLFRANHANGFLDKPWRPVRSPALVNVPRLPFSVLNERVGRTFNSLYSFLHGRRSVKLVNPGSFFFPLDKVSRWNRLYGPRGFYQYQFVLPMGTARVNLNKVFEKLATFGWPKFLGVLKVFGNKDSPGWMSFPMRGVTAAFDVPASNASVLKDLQTLDDIVLKAGGRIYAAKDARMPSQVFWSGQRRMEEVLPWLDAGVSSDFWRRMSRQKG